MHASSGSARIVAIVVAALCIGGVLAAPGSPAASASPSVPSPAMPSPAVAAGATQVAAGAFHTCSLTDGTVRCWGRNVEGELGNGTTEDSALPVQVAGLAGVTSIAAGYMHTCASLAGGTVRCWGKNTDHQLGMGSTANRLVPTAVTGVSGAVAVAAGTTHSCAILTGGTVTCWGDDYYGQLGNGLVGHADGEAVMVDGLTGVTSLALGRYHACAVAGDATVRCWGYDGSGEVGDGVPSTKVASPYTLPGLAGATSVGAADSFSCATLGDGSAWCWGKNASGQLGTGSTSAGSLSPVAVSGVTGATSVALGTTHACASVTGGAVRCWGANVDGQLGDGTHAVVSAATTVTGLSATTSLSVGDDHSCVLSSAGAATCWGSNYSGQFGDGVPTTSPTSVPVAGLTGATKVASGDTHACALKGDGSVWCWGRNQLGQLGDGTTATSSVPVEVAGIHDAIAVDANLDYSCALRAGGTVSCWGRNAYGELGNGSKTSAPVPLPVSVSGLSGATTIDAGREHACAVVAGGGVRCWGRNHRGQLGNGSNEDSSLPVPVSSLTTAVSVGAGEDHSCAVLSDGTVRCWGSNAGGRLGDGTAVSSSVPVTVVGLTGAASVSASSGFACVRLISSGAKCWGTNRYGQLGAASTASNSPSPLAVAGLTDATALVAGYEQACAVRATHAVVCWGTTRYGGLGDGSGLDAAAPVAVAGLTGATAVGSGTWQGCAVVAGGAVRCWGWDAYGQLGRARVAVSSVPVALPTVPGAPAITGVVAQFQAASVSWSAPSNGGSPLTGYVVQPYQGATALSPVVVGPSTTTAEIGGLSNGVAYTFTVAAENLFGRGAPSAASTPLVLSVPWIPFTSWSALVTRQYTDLLGKGPSAASLSSWVDQLTAGTKTKGQLDAALRTGDDNVTNVDATARLYRAFLGRAPDAGGLKFWIGRRRSGSWSLVRMADSFASSTEFRRTYGALTNIQFVTRIYTDVLGRTADASGVAYWTKKLDTKARSRGSVMVGFSESNEYKRKQAANTDVAVAYILLMGRAATAEETAAWVPRDVDAAAHAQLLLELLSSQAYTTHILG